MSKNNPQAAVSAQSDPGGRTPDNTPLPGGGRWIWNAPAGAWVEVPTPADPAENIIKPE